MARYQMYWQVYLHPTSRSFEMILLALFKRMRDLTLEDRNAMDSISFIKPFVSKGDISLKAHYQLDESTCLSGFMTLTECDDPILRDLSSRLLNRDLFKYQDVLDNDQMESIVASVRNLGYDPEYYVIQDYTTQILYMPYEEGVDSGIWVQMKDGSLVELSKASSIVHGFATGNMKEDSKVFFPDKVRTEI
jgi:HD superfamily phosphohydrolase